MKVYYDIPNLNEPTSIVIGNFDGVHKAHDKLIAMGQNAAKEGELKLLILSLYPHPSKVIPYESKLLSTHQQQVELLRKYNPSYIVFMPFSRELQNIEPQDFFNNILIHKLNAKNISVGYNYNFGKNRLGTVEKLRVMCQTAPETVNLSILKQVMINPESLVLSGGEGGTSDDGERISVSSTNIRQALMAGKLDLANAMMGRYYTLSGKIVHGDGIGSKSLYPTINLDWENELLPNDGIYAGYATVFSSIEPTIMDGGAGDGGAGAGAGGADGGAGAGAGAGAGGAGAGADGGAGAGAGAGGAGAGDGDGASKTYTYQCAIYIGKRPSIPRTTSRTTSHTSSYTSPTVEQRAEAYLLNFTGDIHGRYVTLHLTKYIRKDINFPSLEQLKVQITKDILAVQDALTSLPPPSS